MNKLSLFNASFGISRQDKRFSNLDFKSLIFILLEVFFANNLLASTQPHLTSSSRYEVNHNLYINQNKTMNDEYQILIQNAVNSQKYTVANLLRTSFELAAWKKPIRYKLGNNKVPSKNDGKTPGYIDCTSLIYEIFKQAEFETQYFSSYFMVYEKKEVEKYFEYIKPEKTEVQHFKDRKITIPYFRPQAGDILAYHGHAVLVIDPENCIAINATPFVFQENDNGSHYRAHNTTGVFFQKVKLGLCENGLWSSWDRKDRNFWSVMLRHKSIVEEENALKNQDLDALASTN